MEKLNMHEVVRTLTGENTYRISIESRGEQEIPEPSLFRRIALNLTERIIGLFFPRIEPKILGE